MRKVMGKIGWWVAPITLLAMVVWGVLVAIAFSFSIGWAARAALPLTPIWMFGFAYISLCDHLDIDSVPPRA